MIKAPGEFFACVTAPTAFERNEVELPQEWFERWKALGIMAI